MNFSACVLTAALLLLATATALPSNLSPFLRGFGVLADIEILSKTGVCENPRDDPIGTARNLTITDCNYPCVYKRGKTYQVKPSFFCGAKHTNCRLDITETVSIFGLFFEATVLTIPADGNSVVCDKDGIAAPVFTHTVGPTDPPGRFQLNLKVICDGDILEFCRNFDSITTLF